MWSLLGYFRKKPLDCVMDGVYNKINRSKRSITFSKSIIRLLNIVFLAVVLFGGVIISSSLYIYQSNKTKLFMKSAVFSTIFLIVFYIMVYFIRKFMDYRVTKLEKEVVMNENKLVELFEKFMDEGSYNRVLALKEKYDPENRLFSFFGKTSFENDVEEAVDSVNPNYSNRIKSDASLDVESESLAVKPPKEKISKSGSIEYDLGKEKTQENRKCIGSDSPPFKLYKNRTLLDKFLDKLLGDGPENRNALICTVCHTHNGLVPPEDFLNISYKCYNCGFLHLPRRTISMFQASPDLTRNQLISFQNIHEQKLCSDDKAKFINILTTPQHNESLDDTSVESSQSAKSCKELHQESSGGTKVNNQSNAIFETDSANTEEKPLTEVKLTDKEDNIELPSDHH